MARSQVTIAVILGIAVLLIVSITLFIVKSAETKQTVQETIKTQTTASEVKPIIQHITACLESTSSAALELLGLQGGYIFQEQGGIFPNPMERDAGAFFVPFQGRKVNYGISYQKVSLPDYPSRSSPYGPNPEAASTSGIVTFPPLNGSSFSFAYQIEQYAVSSIDQCIDYEFFGKQGYSFTKGEKYVHAALGQERIDVTLFYPLTIINNITNEQLSIDTFQTTKSVRLSTIHAVLSSLLNSDVNSFTFNPSTVQLPEGISLNILPDAYNHDDILLLRDSRSTLAGKSYDIRAARHNRNPALRYLIPNPRWSYLAPGALNFSQNANITSGLLTIYLGQPLADDPDEDAITYNFTVESRAGNPPLPQSLTTPDMKVRITASDGEKEDYQTITIIRNPEDS
ncbi:MAG: hypothetical protein HY518_04630 [Candidatus Aenigmarchaeota archaeon]|nr:hypothetical protein [Candidatus Aenigmarchaeota archaeon]